MSTKTQVAVAIILLYSLAMVSVGRYVQLTKMRQVRAICLTNDEQACSGAMAATSTEFLCNTNYCWTEVK